jgi:hypothetical protein
MKLVGKPDAGNRHVRFDPTFVQRLIEAHHINQRKIARLLLNNPQYLARYSAAEIAAMQRVVADVDAMEAAPNLKLRDINWADVALKHCPDLYQLLYRSFSSDGTHATLSSLDRYVITDTSMEITAFKATPDGEGVVEVLSAACLLFMWAADPFAVAVDRPDINRADQGATTTLRLAAGRVSGRSTRRRLAHENDRPDAYDHRRYCPAGEQPTARPCSLQA